MIVVGLTGGIGSGKSTIARLFEALGIPVYIADIQAKRLMNSSKAIRRELIKLFGDDAYIDNDLNRAYIASKIFKDDSLLTQMNAIIHPEVGLDFKRWLKKQHSKYVIKEAAIIFEQQMESQYDYIITVTANTQDKIDRVIKRDGTTKDKVIAIMNHQISDEEKIKKSHFVIVNDHIEDAQKQVLKIHEKLLQNSIKS